jgi:DNA replicative helicase MCM subunit Mcm2 (Cdc46/Mcm family)
MSDGLSEEEIVGHAFNEGLSEDETREMLRKMKMKGDLYCPTDGRYKRT